MGQKITAENSATVNLIKKDLFDKHVDELLSCCHDNTSLDRIKELLLSNERLANCKGKKLRSPLHIAAENGQVAIILELISYGADIDALDFANRSPLMYACDNCRVDATRVLLSAGADCNLCDKYAISPLHLAADKGSEDLTVLLLGANAKVDALNRWNRTPLMHAAAAGSLLTIELLVRAGADVNARDIVGKSVLVKACANFHFDCALYLIQCGAALDLQSRHIAEIMESHDYDGEFAQLKEASIEYCNHEGPRPLARIPPLTVNTSISASSHQLWSPSNADCTEGEIDESSVWY